MTTAGPAMDALIGHTGLVGGTLDRSGWPFGARFNSRNIEDMRGGRFGTIVCAGVSAVKWKANREPEQDWAGIRRLWDVLATVSADRVVLISTIDVYPAPVGVTEDDHPARGGVEAYGRHRLELEHLVRERFARHAIVRLPALFGIGLRKNAIFDMLTGNMTDRIAPEGVLQWYPLRRLRDDLRRTIDSGISLLNVAVEPVRTADIATRFFPGVVIGSPEMAAPRYDMRTRHAQLLGGHGDYHLSADRSLAELGAYVSDARHAGQP